MAIVNLGSIKFNWKGAYSGATAYVVDDVVESSGSSYICIAATTGNAPPNATYWEQMSSAGTNGTDGTDLTTTLTTQGDILYRDGSGLQRLGAGTAGQLLQSGGTGANVSWTDAPAGITNAQQWRPTTTTSSAGSIVNSWEKVDTFGPGSIGCDMTLTNSNEWFNFPETGIWWIYFTGNMYSSGGGTQYMGMAIEASTNSGSSWDQTSIGWDSSYGNEAYGNVSTSFMFDVTNTSTHLIRIAIASKQANTPYLGGSTTYNGAEATFIRLGDT